MAELTTEQFAEFTVPVTDGRGRPMTAENYSVASSDETVLRATINADGSGGRVDSVAPGGPARFVVTADAKLGEGERLIVATSEDITVTMDPRSEARFGEVAIGAAQDKAV